MLRLLPSWLNGNQKTKVRREICTISEMFSPHSSNTSQTWEIEDDSRQPSWWCQPIRDFSVMFKLSLRSPSFCLCDELFQIYSWSAHACKSVVFKCCYNPVACKINNVTRGANCNFCILQICLGKKNFVLLKQYGWDINLNLKANFYDKIANEFILVVFLTSIVPSNNKNFLFAVAELWCVNIRIINENEKHRILYNGAKPNLAI